MKLRYNYFIFKYKYSEKRHKTMDITIRKQYKAISPFEHKGLPDLVVLTGENGTGKTQLLEYLYYGSRLDDNGIIDPTPEGDDSFGDMPRPEESGNITGEGVMEVVLPCEIRSEGKRLRNVVYRGVQAPTVDVGSKFNLDKLYVGGENIAQKHLFYKTHSVLKNLDEMNTSELTNYFNSVLGVKKASRSSDAEYPELTTTDIEIIKRIEKEFPTPDYVKDPFYYVAFQQPPTGKVFTANLKFLYFQYWARIQAGMPVGLAPWEAFNQIGQMLNFKFELDEPKIEEKKFDVRLRDKERKVFISPDSLSSGEKVIFSLFVAMYTTHSQEHLPSLIIFDEPDAYLHPSLCSTMLKVIKDVLIGEHGIKVIMTTHSPTTVAMLPETSLFCMKDGVMKKTTKQEAILALTAGLNTISVYYENVKQVFVEADNDNIFLTNVYHQAMMKGLLNKDINLRFVNVGDKKDGGCTTATKVVNDLWKAGNKTVYGIIDYDGKNNPSERIKILGGGSRYAIDNYLMDPLVLSMLFLDEASEKTRFGFEINDTLVGYGKKTAKERQEYCNKLLAILESNISADKRSDTTPVKYKTIGGDEYVIPKWYTTIQGHQLVSYVRNTMLFLGKYRDDKALYKRIVDYCYSNYPEIIPLELVETLKEIQNA